jgi:hypothetical protein
MGASVIPSTIAGDNWVLISSVTPTLAATTVTFSSITGYRKLMFRNNGCTLGSAGAVNLTFNGDTGANYAWASIQGASTYSSKVENAGNNFNFAPGSSSSTINGYNLFINDSNTAGLKTCTGFGVQTGSTSPSIQGFYLASAAITSVTFTTTTSFAATGTVALYGVAA